MQQNQSAKVFLTKTKNRFEIIAVEVVSPLQSAWYWEFDINISIITGWVFEYWSRLNFYEIQDFVSMLA